MRRVFLDRSMSIYLAATLRRRKVRTSLTTLLFPGRPFSLLRHFLIAFVLLAFNNTLVIFVPTIKDIFGFIGASAATLLIFILPAAFYLRIVKKEPFRSPQKIGEGRLPVSTRARQRVSIAIFFILILYFTLKYGFRYRFPILQTYRNSVSEFRYQIQKIANLMADPTQGSGRVS
ncbi:unnamed protein product [Ranitomeya imitator]|uniref:Amino acid transporter transmembrane domain-containing protein n=1 Tax=Ranitomeya imitator TaxID=111125 RepID=A0ABN9M1K2_9NEOB|nr:unnamed protein product [Ranitomeya imitator]